MDALDRYTTDNYLINVGENVDVDTKKVSTIYQILNKHTGVVEYDDFILPRTIEALSNLEEKLQEASDEFFRNKSPQLSLIGEDNGEGSIH